MEIDLRKCDYYFQGRCGVSKNINYSIGCYANDCYFKQLQQLKESNKTLNDMLLILNNRIEEYKRIYGEL